MQDNTEQVLIDFPKGCAIPYFNDILIMVVIIFVIIVVAIYQLRKYNPEHKDQILYCGLIVISLCIIFYNSFLNLFLYTFGLRNLMRCQVTWEETKSIFDKMLNGSKK